MIKHLILSQKGLEKGTIYEVLMLKEESPFLACKRVFSALYNQVDSDRLKKVSRHPNNYFATAYDLVYKKNALKNVNLLS